MLAFPANAQQILNIIPFTMRVNCADTKQLFEVFREKFIHLGYGYNLNENKVNQLVNIWLGKDNEMFVTETVSTEDGIRITCIISASENFSFVKNIRLPENVMPHAKESR